MKNDTRSLASAVTPAMCGVRSRFGQPAKGSIGGERLAREHVERSPAQPAASQRRRDGGFVDDAAARRVDEHRSWLHRRDPRRVDQAARRLEQRNVQAHDVGRGEQLVEAERRRHRPATNAGSPGSSIASVATTRMPIPCASRAVTRPIEPKPTKPIVLAPISRPLPSAWRGHPRRRPRPSSGRRRAAAALPRRSRTPRPRARWRRSPR